MIIEYKLKLIEEFRNSIEAVKSKDLGLDETYAIAALLENNTAYGKKDLNDANDLLAFTNMYFGVNFNIEDYNLLNQITYDEMNNGLVLSLDKTPTMESLYENFSNNNTDTFDYLDKYQKNKKEELVNNVEEELPLTLISAAKELTKHHHSH